MSRLFISICPSDEDATGIDILMATPGVLQIAAQSLPQNELLGLIQSIKEWQNTK